MKKKVRIGIVGLGRVFEHYLKLFKKKKIKNYQLTSICDIDKKKSSYAKSLNVNFYNNFKNPDFYKNIDLVLILTMSGNHYPIAKFFINKKIHVLCEKPLTMTPSKSLDLFKDSKKRKVICGVVFQNRFNPSIQLVKKTVSNGNFGKIVNVSISLLWCRYQKYYNDKWHGTWLNDGGVLNQQLIHHLDILRWIFGPIKMVNCITTKRLNKLEAEDTAAAIIKLSNGSLCTIEATTAARPIDLHASMSVVGEKGTAVISGIAMNKVKTWKFKNQNHFQENKIKKTYSKNVPTGYGVSHITYLNNTFKNILKKKFKPPVDAYEAYLTSLFVHSLYKSSETSKWVKVNSNSFSKMLGKKN